MLSCDWLLYYLLFKITQSQSDYLSLVHKLVLIISTYSFTEYKKAEVGGSCVDEKQIHVDWGFLFYLPDVSICVLLSYLWFTGMDLLPCKSLFTLIWIGIEACWPVLSFRKWPLGFGSAIAFYPSLNKQKPKTRIRYVNTFNSSIIFFFQSFTQPKQSCTLKMGSTW